MNNYAKKLSFLTVSKANRPEYKKTTCTHSICGDSNDYL